MSEVSIIGVDLAKTVFHLHGAASDGSVGFRRKLRRAQVLPFLAEQPRCTVAMEACASAHHWARAIAEMGHAVELIPPIYVKPFVKRQKNDAADAEAIAEAASRPTMRFVAVKSEAQQAAGMTYRTRDLLVRQRTVDQCAAGSPRRVRCHRADRHRPCRTARSAGRGRGRRTSSAGSRARAYPARPDRRDDGADRGARRAGSPACERRSRREAAHDHSRRRRHRGHCADHFAPPPETFAKGRDFAAWVGLTPRQHSTGGRERLGKITRMGQRDIRRLLITDAVAVVRWAARKGAPEGTWLARMLAKKPRMLVAVALANRMARVPGR